jgi:5-amino-6-(5-phosphoribosylamino)uracil reductase
VLTVRLVLAVSLDGRLAPAGGGAAQLGGVGDRLMLDQALAWADACLLGAGTLRAHQSTCLLRDLALQQQRLKQGRPAQPIAVVVSHQSAFPQGWLFFQQPLQRWLLAPQPPAEGFERWLPLQSTWPQHLEALQRAGIRRLVLLGGAQLAAELFQVDAVDELQLTVSPRLLGGANSWIPPHTIDLPEALQQPDAWCFQAADPLQGDELLLRYRRRRGEPAPSVE